MVISSFYNSDKKVLIITSDKISNKKKLQTIEENGFKVIKILDEEDNLIGLNIFNFISDKITTGIVNNKQISNIIEKYFTENSVNPYIVGEVVDIKKHPSSDHLNICQVNLGNEVVQIVCGAKNISNNIKVIVSQVGAVMPNGLLIKPSQLLGEKSNGMISSLYELGLHSDNTKGIAILDDSYEVGNVFSK